MYIEQRSKHDVDWGKGQIWNVFCRSFVFDSWFSLGSLNNEIFTVVMNFARLGPLRKLFLSDIYY